MPDKLGSSEILSLWIEEQQASGMSNRDISNHAFTYKGSVLLLTISNAKKGTFNLLTKLGAVDLAEWYSKRLEGITSGPKD